MSLLHATGTAGGALEPAHQPPIVSWPRPGCSRASVSPPASLHCRIRGCSREQQHRQRQAACRAAPPNWNPQNVPDPQVMPSKQFSAEQAVRAQLDALKENDSPWANHGIATAYHFAADAGGMERSLYFHPRSVDLYHQDHFNGRFQNYFPELVGLADYSIEGAQELPDGRHEVDVAVTNGGKSARVRFTLVRKELGRRKGALMTATLVRL